MFYAIKTLLFLGLPAFGYLSLLVLHLEFFRLFTVAGKTIKLAVTAIARFEGQHMWQSKVQYCINSFCKGSIAIVSAQINT